jgi:hypothetical protein
MSGCTRSNGTMGPATGVSASPHSHTARRHVTTTLISLERATNRAQLVIASVRGE